MKSTFFTTPSNRNFDTTPVKGILLLLLQYCDNKKSNFSLE